MLKKALITSSFLLLAATAPAAEQSDLLALRAETRQLEQQMYDLFNALNSDDQFDVACGEHKVTGSTIPEWRCEAAFMRNASARSTSSRFDNPLAAAANTQGGYVPQSSRQIGFNQRKKVEQLNQEMMTLARQNPPLAAAMIAYNDKRQQLEKAGK